MRYINKINNHIRLDFEDIKDFCVTQISLLELHEYVTDIRINNIIFGLANYSDYEKEICISDEFKALFKSFRNEYQNILDRLLCNPNDLYNLFVIKTIFHELWHAKQKKELDENPTSYCSKLLSISFEFMKKSGTTYNYYHDRYYHEYNAIINSTLLTLTFVKSLKLDERALNIINKSFADEILQSYGISKEKDLKIQYNSPILFNKFLMKYLSYNNEIINIDDLIEFYKNRQNTNNDISNLIEGNQVSISTIEKLQKIRDDKLKTANILEELNFDLRDYKRL